MAEYETKLITVDIVPAADSLVACDHVMAWPVELTEPGEYKRGEVLMLTGSGWGKITEAGLSAALDFGILCHALTLEEGETVRAYSYLFGTFRGSELVYDESIDSGELEKALARIRLFIV